MNKATMLTNVLRKHGLDLVVGWHYSYFQTNGHRIGRSFDEAYSYLEGEQTDYPQYERNHGIKILKKKFPEDIVTKRLKPIR